MNLKHLLLAGGMLIGSLAVAEEAKIEIPNAVPGKIAILVADVGTIDTVAGTEEWLAKIKQFNIESRPSVSAADKAGDPNVARTEIKVNFAANWSEYNEEQKEIARQNRKMEAILDHLRTSISSDPKKRDIIVAKNYLQSYLTPYSDYIAVVDRANTNLAELEKAINGTDQQDLASAVVFLTVIMQDLHEESQTVEVHGTKIKKTWYTQKAVGNVRDFNGNVITSFDVVAKTSRRQTSASSTQGFNPSSDLMEEVLKQIAEKVAAYYVKTLEIECIGPKGDDDFDEDEVVITVDGKEFDSGDQILIGKHTVVGEIDGYKKVTKQIDLAGNKTSTTVKMKFKKAPVQTEENAQ